MNDPREQLQFGHKGSRGKDAQPRQPRRPTAADGIIVVDKPTGMTSHDVVAIMRRLAGTRKVGHAGTLDPMATGLLVVGVGRGTRLLHFLTAADKSYTATVRLGVATVSEDADGDVTDTQPCDHVTREQLQAAAARLTGVIDQVPSAVSAVKIDGRRAYDRVRAGEDVVLPARSVTVSRFDIVDVVDGPPHHGVATKDVLVSVDVSSGTYVRALGRDLAQIVGTVGHLVALRRTRVAEWTLAEARSVPQLQDTDPTVPLDVMDLGSAAERALRVWRVSEAQAGRLAHGQRLTTELSGQYAAVSETGELVAVVQCGQGVARPVTVFVSGVQGASS